MQKCSVDGCMNMQTNPHIKLKGLIICSEHYRDHMQGKIHLVTVSHGVCPTCGHSTIRQIAEIGEPNAPLQNS
jgi:hypothetical protein